MHALSYAVLSLLCQKQTEMLFLHEGDERVPEWCGRADQGTWGGATLESGLFVLHSHALSLIHCLPSSLILPLSVSFPSSHILLSSSTYFLGSGGGCRYMTWSSMWKTKQNWDRFSTLWSNLTLLLTYPHLKFVLCFCCSPSCPHIGSVSMVLPTNTPLHTHRFMHITWRALQS